MHLKPDSDYYLFSLTPCLPSKRESAVLCINCCIMPQPANPANHYNLGKCLEKKGDMRRARIYYLKFIDLARANDFSAK